MPSAMGESGTRGLRATYTSEREIFLSSPLCKGCEMVMSPQFQVYSGACQPEPLNVH